MKTKWTRVHWQRRMMGLFAVGVSSLALMNACPDYASPGRFALFYADATLQLSELEYPVIFGFPQILSTCRYLGCEPLHNQKIRHLLSALVSMVKRACSTSMLHIATVMGNAEDAQLNKFHDVFNVFLSRVVQCAETDSPPVVETLKSCNGRNRSDSLGCQHEHILQTERHGPG
ncbi:hypothetical protein GN958_ATG12329 [Phytophthora infestans]|uniref:Uncharacterized protein n=1 Tax=Phytophthora infestans TaxID=4787 RepID=A0A8S9UD79_PHYIN|nr:hypothetical protein GN958_ATG12329 [Phytophthora infestans]